MKIKLSLIGLFFILASCSYQKESFEKEKLGGAGTTSSLNSIGNSESSEFCVKQFSEKRNLTAFSQALDKYYGTYLKVINPDNESYDTGVDYLKMMEDSKLDSEGYLKRRQTLLDLISQENLEGKTNAYKVAFYINAYNFLAIDFVAQASIENGELTSILAAGEDRNVFSHPSFKRQVAGERLTLDEIEKGKLDELTAQAEKKDARLHFAVICASRGCPVLLREPFSEEELEKQLNRVTCLGVNKERMVRIDNNTTYLSQIFKWYTPHFANHLFPTEAPLPEESNRNYKTLTSAFINYYSNGKVNPIGKFSIAEYDWFPNQAE